MANVQHITRKELTAREIVDILATGGRVVIELDILGTTTRVVIRQHEGTYYCDTPMKLMKYDAEKDLRECLDRFRLTRRESNEPGELATTA